ncbi:MAG: phage holin family protein [Zoogloeaceae bacterium]|jgi:uncharacterized membrane protein YqjE|nr:phage holin family protein [Zoogloeaceae bacterium]
MATNQAAPGLFRHLRLLLAEALDAGRTRLALLANELEEEKIRFVASLAQVILALAALVIGAVLLVAFLTLLFWESRLWVLGASSLLFFVLALGFALSGRAAFLRGSPLFKTSLAELRTDAARLRQSGEPEHESPSA